MHLMTLILTAHMHALHSYRAGSVSRIIGHSMVRELTYRATSHLFNTLGYGMVVGILVMFLFASLLHLWVVSRSR